MDSGISPGCASREHKFLSEDEQRIWHPSGRLALSSRKSNFKAQRRAPDETIMTELFADGAGAFQA